MEIIRQGLSQPITIEVVRDVIPIETVFSQTFQSGGKKIGYIEITSFAKETGKDFKKHLQSLEKEKIDGLIIDVRGNPGGLLSSVVEIVGEIVTNKKPIMQIEKKIKPGNKSIQRKKIENLIRSLY